jgi:polyphosphate kinase
MPDNHVIFCSLENVFCNYYAVYTVPWQNICSLLSLHVHFHEEHKMWARQLKRFRLNVVLEENSKSCHTKLVLTVISELQKIDLYIYF